MSLRASRGDVIAQRDVVLPWVIEKKIVRMAGWGREHLGDVQSSIANVVITGTDDNSFHVLSE